MNRRDVFWLTLCFAAVLLITALSFSVGSSSLNASEIWGWLMDGSVDESTKFVLSGLRLPRTLTCLAVGGSLALAGAMLQTLLDNPLSEPYTLGLSGASSLGGVLIFLLGWEPYWITVPSGAFAICWLVTFFLILRVRESVGSGSKTLILTGVMISFLCASTVSLLMSLLEPSKLQQAIYWMIGQAGSSRDLWWPFTTASLSVVFIWSQLQARHFDRILLGEEMAASLGTPIVRFRIYTVLFSAWLTSMSVSQVGIMGFVGLLSPHFARNLLGHRRHSSLFALSIMLGAIMLTAADVLGRALSHGQEIPAGSLVALVGAPVFLFRLLNRRSRIAAPAE